MSGINIDVVCKDIKNVHITVYPPMGRVRVSAPRHLNNEQVRLTVVGRLAWIHRQRERLSAAHWQPADEFVTGESHYVWGVRRRLNVVQVRGRAHVEMEGSQLTLFVRTGYNAEERRRTLDAWYREQLRLAIPQVIAKWEPRMNVAVPQWRIRQMKTRWGTCNRQTGRITLNVELAKKHPNCLEYVVVHEMVHYFERNHGAPFTTLMDGFMPDWRSRRDRLNGPPVRDEEWDDPPTPLTGSGSASAG